MECVGLAAGPRYHLSWLSGARVPLSQRFGILADGALRFTTRFTPGLHRGLQLIKFRTPIELKLPQSRNVKYRSCILGDTLNVLPSSGCPKCSIPLRIL
jgi:hypothetical protein